MNIAILGTGRVGSALGSRWAEQGHQIFFGVRETDCEEVRNAVARAGSNARAVGLAEAVAAGDVVVLAIPWDAVREVLDAVGPLDGKILVDCINPLAPDLKGLQFGFTTSAAEQIAAWAPSARVVKAFNTLSDAAMVDPWFGDQKASIFYCGDDEEAKGVIRTLTEALDLEAVDAGPLVNARQLEPLSMLYVYLAVFGGWGGDCAFKMMKR